MGCGAEMSETAAHISDLARNNTIGNCIRLTSSPIAMWEQLCFLNRVDCKEFYRAGRRRLMSFLFRRITVVCTEITV